MEEGESLGCGPSAAFSCDILPQMASVSPADLILFALIWSGFHMGPQELVLCKGSWRLGVAVIRAALLCCNRETRMFWGPQNSVNLLAIELRLFTSILSL